MIAFGTRCRLALATCPALLSLLLAGVATASSHAGRIELTPLEQRFVAENPVLRLCIDPDFLPYEALDENGEHIGIVAEFMQEFAALSGFSFEVVRTASWQETLQLAAEGGCDVVSAINQTREREQYLSFTEHYVNEPSMLVTAADRTDIRTMQDLAGKRLAIVSGYSLDEYLALDHPDVTRLYVASLREGLALVAAGEADATAGDRFVMESLLAADVGAGLKLAGESGYLSLLRLGVRRDSPQAYSVLNKAIKSLDEAQRLTIRERYMPAP